MDSPLPTDTKIASNRIKNHFKRRKNERGRRRVTAGKTANLAIIILLLSLSVYFITQLFALDAEYQRIGNRIDPLQKEYDSISKIIKENEGSNTEYMADDYWSDLKLANKLREEISDLKYNRQRQRYEAFKIRKHLFTIELAFYFFLLRFVYIMWSAIPKNEAATTPFRAVALLFIPVFFYYWIFNAIDGWGKTVNRVIGRSVEDISPMDTSFPFLLTGAIIVEYTIEASNAFIVFFTGTRFYALFIASLTVGVVVKLFSISFVASASDVINQLAKTDIAPAGVNERALIHEEDGWAE